MAENLTLVRYAVINKKNCREIVLLRGTGCVWQRCRFCDYHLDCGDDKELNYQLNRNQLNKVTGVYKKLEIINSGSFTELDKKTISEIENTALKKGITDLYFECHWIYKDHIQPLKEYFAEKNIRVKIKTGVETFDKKLREGYLDKGIGAKVPSEIAEYFDECCLLQGIKGQTEQSMLNDIQTGLKYFERVCINIMQNNTSEIKADESVIKIFMEKIYPVYYNDYRVDILTENTAFGVGGSNG